MIRKSLLVLLSCSVFCNSLCEISYGIAEMQGLRSTMEDAHCIEITEDYAFFGLFDGHGGRDVADFAADMLYINCDFILQKTDDDIIKALERGFVKTHEDLDEAEFDSMRQGSTAVVAFMRDGQLYVASTGDSRAELCSNGEAVALTDDHKPNRTDEKKRIEDLGGKIIFYGVWRVNGMLAVSRALGDKSLAPYVIPHPEIIQRTLLPQDEFVIIACDGVWDVLSNQEAVNIVKESLKNKSNSLDIAAAVLRDAAYNKGSSDNISVMIVNLQDWQR